MLLLSLTGTISVVAADLSRPERGLSTFLGLGVSRGLGRDPAWVLHWRLLRGAWAAQPTWWMPHSCPQAKASLAPSSVSTAVIRKAAPQCGSWPMEKADCSGHSSLNCLMTLILEKPYFSGGCNSSFWMRTLISGNLNGRHGGQSRASLSCLNGMGLWPWTSDTKASLLRGLLSRGQTD